MRSLFKVSVVFIVPLIVTAVAFSPAMAGPGEHSSEKHKLGRQKIGDYTVSVIMIGEPEAGHTVDFDIKLFDNEKDPTALRVWIGAEDAKGSDVVELKKKTTTFVGTAKSPDPLPKDWKVWVELQTESGAAKGSYKLEHDHKH